MAYKEASFSQWDIILEVEVVVVVSKRVDRIRAGTLNDHYAVLPEDRMGLTSRMDIVKMRSEAVRSMIHTGCHVSGMLEGTRGQRKEGTVSGTLILCLKQSRTTAVCWWNRNAIQGLQRGLLGTEVASFSLLDAQSCNHLHTTLTTSASSLLLVM